MRSFFLFSAFLFFISVNAQKRTLEVIDAAGIEAIHISSDEIFKITLSTGAGKEIKIRSVTDGEYYDDISLQTHIEGSILKLESQYQEILQSGFDKLSAHKVLSMEIELEIPEGMRVDISSNVATVHGKGKYDKLFIQLKSGSCYLSEFLGDAVINTFEGNVIVKTGNAKVEATSRHGLVHVQSDNYGKHKIAITSINGNISVEKTK